MFTRKKKLVDPFPIDDILLLDFGDADGHRDDFKMLEEYFILTASIRKLIIQKKNPIISGHIGTGKSTIYTLIKNKSYILKDYLKGKLIVPIEESISFKSLKFFISNYLPDTESKLIYQMVWMFHIAIRLSEKISEYESFPINNDEKEINKFLKQTDSKGSYNDIVDRIVNLFDNFMFKVEAKILNKPISLKTSLKSPKKNNTNLKININKIINHCSQAISKRQVEALIIIDKIDKFVAGEDYRVQKNYIQSLLEVEDDLFKIDNIRFNIFVRSDLLKRLDYSSLGVEKINDRTLTLEWTNDELLQFIGIRIFTALTYQKIVSLDMLMNASDIPKYHFSHITFFQKIKIFLKKPFKAFKKKHLEKDDAFYTTFAFKCITKIFPRQVVRYDSEEEDTLIPIDNFFTTHFKNGHEITTPRILLTFLKEIQNITMTYYLDNPFYEPNVVKNNRDYEWNLITKECVYDAYLSSKKIYIENIYGFDEEWRNPLIHLCVVIENKTSFSYNWIKKYLKTNDDGTTEFISFLINIGFFKTKIHNTDFKQRVFELPLIYNQSSLKKAH